jgi:predicted GNAT family N-acyltransferase
MTEIAARTPDMIDGAVRAPLVTAALDMPTDEHPYLDPTSSSLYEHDAALTRYLEFADEHEHLLAQTRLGRAREHGKNAIAAVGVAVSAPGVYELALAGTVGTSVGTTNNPLLAAGIATGFTAVAEAGSALGTARLLETERSQRVMRAANKILGKMGLRPEGETSLATDAALAFVAGSGTMLAMKQTLDPDRTKKENRRRGLTTAAISTVMAAPVNLAIAEGINEITPTRVALGAVAVAGFLGVKKAISKHLRTQNTSNEAFVDRDRHASYRLVTDVQELTDAAILEQEVWDEKGFGKLEEEGYGKYIAHSRTFAAFDDQGNCIGVERMFAADEEAEIIQPFLQMDFFDLKKQNELVGEALNGEIEELGTVAVDPAYRGKNVNLRLQRQALRDSQARGVKKWGIIMEPDRVAKMNTKHGFTFEQLGPAVPYQGGDCAPFVMTLDEGLDSIRQKSFLKWYWFAKMPLKA